MGNCQAAETATVVIVHPENRVERVYWSVGATQIMNSNPGHYVAQLVTSPSAKNPEDGKPLKHLKLLRPDDTLHIGQVYRLVSFEDVLNEFAAKKCVKLGKMHKETGGVDSAEKMRRRRRRRDRNNDVDPLLNRNDSVKVEQEAQQQEENSVTGVTSSNSSRGVLGRQLHYQSGQWKPALQSIAEVGS